MTNVTLTHGHLSTLLAYVDAERARGLLDDGICVAMLTYLGGLRAHLESGTMSAGAVAAVALGLRTAIP